MHRESGSSVTQGQPSDTDNDVKVKVSLEPPGSPLKESGGVQPSMGSSVSGRYTGSRPMGRKGVSFRADRDQGQERTMRPLLSIDQVMY